MCFINNKQSIYLSTPKKPWYQQGLSFPCPLDKHSHQRSSCKELFSMCPENWWKFWWKKVGYTTAVYVLRMYAKAGNASSDPH